MNKKPNNNIVPQIHNLQDCWFIQWIGNEYYIKKSLMKRFVNIYSLVNFVILIFIWSVAGIFPLNDIEDVTKMFILSVLTGIMNGISIAEDRNINS